MVICYFLWQQHRGLKHPANKAVTIRLSFFMFFMLFMLYWVHTKGQYHVSAAVAIQDYRQVGTLFTLHMLRKILINWNIRL